MGAAVGLVGGRGAEGRQHQADRGIARLRSLALSLDLAVVSAGGLAESSGSLVRQLITEAEATDLLARGAVDVASMISSRFPLAESPAAFEVAAKSGILKVLLTTDK